LPYVDIIIAFRIYLIPVIPIKNEVDKGVFMLRFIIGKRKNKAVRSIR